MLFRSDLARRLLSGAQHGGAAIAAALSPHATLRAQRLIDAIEPPAMRPSQLNAGYALAPALARYLCGVALTPPDACARIADARCAWDQLPFAPALVERLRDLARLLAVERDARPALLLVGEHTGDLVLASAACARSLGLPLRTVDLASVRHGGNAAGAFAALALELRLEPAVLCVTGLGAVGDRETARAPVDVLGLLDAPEFAQVPLIVIAPPASPWRDVLGERRVLSIELGAPDYAQRLVLWRRALAAAELPLAAEDCAALAARFRLPPARIGDAVATVQDWSLLRSDDATAGLGLFVLAARAQSHERVGALATRVAATHGWDDLVLPTATFASLQQLTDAIRHRHIVYADWDFGRRVQTGKGVKALFAGASGTGKTMAAGVIARDLGLDLYKIDLSGLVSKFIGETERNLDKVFGAARSGNAMLFFDEADAVFGKRSEVKDAHDRYANIETAYLLQKLEEHDGVVILASNLKRNIDDAFARRLHYVVDFATPDAPQREALWRGMFPAAAPLADDLDFAFLARQFELAGGDIRNVALDAAFLAACGDRRIAMRHLVKALARQWAKQGRTPTRAEFQRYYEWLD